MMPRRPFTPYPTLPQHERAPPTPGARSLPATLLVAALLASLLPEAEAQELEPRAYSNLPIGMNFLALGYAYSRGGLATDPSLPVEDAHLKIHTGITAYVRSLDFWGRSARSTSSSRTRASPAPRWSPASRPGARSAASAIRSCAWR